MEVLNPTIVTTSKLLSNVSILSHKSSISTWRKKNPCKLGTPSYRQTIYPPFPTCFPRTATRRLQISASQTGRPTNRRNSLRKKLTGQRQQVRLNLLVHEKSFDSRNPVQDSGDSERINSNLENDTDDRVNEGLVDSDDVGTSKSESLRDSVLWNRLESWADQYKNDSAFWGIGFDPIFTVYQDLKGNVKRVVVNEEEIMKRNGVEPNLYRKKSKLEEFAGVNTKISHARSLANEMEKGNDVFKNNSSLTRFVVEETQPSFVQAVRSLTMPPGLFKNLPKFGMLVFFGIFVFLTVKTVFTGNEDKKELTSFEKEMMRRKIKARKEKEKLVKGSVEVIEAPTEPAMVSGKRPKLDQQELLNTIAKQKASTDFDSKVQEIRVMARHAREIERSGSPPDEIEGEDQLIAQSELIEQEVSKNREGVVSSADHFDELLVQAQVVNGTSTQISPNDEKSIDIEVGKVSSKDVESTIAEVVEGEGGMSLLETNEVSQSCDTINGKTTKPKRKLKTTGRIIRSVKEAKEFLAQKRDKRGPEEVLVGKNTVRSGLTKNLEREEERGSRLKQELDKDNGEHVYSILDETSDLKPSELGSKSSSTSVRRTKEFLAQKRHTREHKQELEGGDTKWQNAVMSNLESEKVIGNSSGEKFDKDNEEPVSSILNGSSSPKPSMNGGNDSFLMSNGSVQTDRSYPEALANEPSVLALPGENEADKKPSEGLYNNKEVSQPASLNEILDSSSGTSSYEDSTSKVWKGIDSEELVDEHWDDDIQSPTTSASNEQINRNADKVSEENKGNWLEENFHELDPVLEKIRGGFRDNYKVAKENVQQELNISFETMQSKLDEGDGELEWMRNDELREIVFQVRDNELAGLDPFHQISDEDKLKFYKGLEEKVEKENQKLSNLHDWLHSNIENLDYGADGISLYDSPDKIIPRWKGPALGEIGEFFNNISDQKRTLERNLNNSNTKKKGAQNPLQKSKEPSTSGSISPTQKTNKDTLKNPDTVIEGSNGTIRAGKKSGKEYWEHTKKWSRGFLDSYNSADPETKAIMKDIGKDLDRWITEEEIQEAATVMDRVPEKGRQYIEKKINKVKREMELFGPQAVVSKYREYADDKEEDYLWWLDLSFVLCIELYTEENGEQRIGLYSLEMGADLEMDPKQHHVIAFEEPGDCKNLCYIIQAHMEMLGNGNAFVVARPPKDAFREAKANGFSVTVIRKGELQLNIDQPLEEVEEQITEVGSKIYHDKIMREQSMDISGVMKGVFGTIKPSKRRRSRQKLKKKKKPTQ